MISQIGSMFQTKMKKYTYIFNMIGGIKWMKSNQKTFHMILNVVLMVQNAIQIKNRIKININLNVKSQ